MRIVLDTNVFVSAVFFGGPPGRILEAWRGGRLQLVMSPEILEEYQRVGEILRDEHPSVDLEPLLALLAVHADLIEAPPLGEPVCADLDDDKFFACAVAAGVTLIVSGDKDLVEQSGWRGIRVLRPRGFVDEHLPQAGR